MHNLSTAKNSYQVSVVIATLGGHSLKATVEALNQSSILPAEILICIPNIVVENVPKFIDPNVRVVATDCKGQVAQRAVGFRHARYNIVMQIDDDMIVDTHCIDRLLATLKEYGCKIAVAPLLVNKNTGESVYKKKVRNRFLDKLYYWLMNGSSGHQQGKIEKSGCPVGIDPGVIKKIFDVDWLAGGCVMHCRNNLILENFYPFQGKAYCEDLIHSHLLKSRRIRLLVNSDARCAMESISLFDLHPREFFRNLTFDFRARRYFMNLSSQNCVRMYMFYAIISIVYIYDFIKRGKLNVA